MRHIFSFLNILLWLGSAPLPAQAQQYPVQATVQLLPPYSVYLSDYANERLVVQLQLRDLSKGEIPVRLRWQIQGAGVSLETKPTYLPLPNTVGVGIPLRLDGYDLAPYLQPENLLGSGVGAAWRRQAQLPEGLYTFCVQVLDDVTGAVVSNSACASAWLLRHDPPWLNLPEEAAHPQAREPQQLTFQWTPRHTGRPNAAFQTEYDFRLVEIWPDNRNPNEAMRTSVPLYETTTPATMLVYGPAEPSLVPGRRYAWQVRARSLVNGESLDMFNNQGYSEVRSFQWGDACLTLTDLQAKALTGGRLRLRWEAPPTHTGFQVRYRRRGTTRWYQRETFRTEIILTQLNPNTAYEYQVGGFCGSIAAELSPTAVVQTLEEVIPQYACGLPLPNPSIESSEALPALLPGDVIQAGDFPVTVTESTGQAGRFSGTGTVALPWLRESVAQVTFQDVQINDAYQLTAGQLVVNGVALEIVPDEWTRPLADVYDGVDQAERALEQLPPTDQTDTTVIEVEGTVTEAYVNERGQVVAVDTEGSETVVAQEVPPGGSVTVQDSQGNAHTVNSGSLASTTSGRHQDHPVADFSVQFKATERQTYGFDAQQHDALAIDYEQALINNENYRVAWKSVASGRTDYVDAVATPADSFPASVSFRTLTGPATAQPASDEQERQVLVVGTTHQAIEALTAYVTEQDTAGNDVEISVGQLNVISYDELRQKLVVVPVNEAAAPNASLLSQELNRIYGAAVAHWEVVIDEPFVAEAGLLEDWDEGSSGLLASFPQPMRKFNRTFKRSRNIDQDAYYVFLVPGASSSRAGFMPFKQQFGYIFTTQTSELSHAIAHELGHGAFRLRHTFDEFGLAQGSTDNLMDYSEGAKLYKYQWDNVHDPEAMVGWLQRDEESAYKRIMDDDLMSMLLTFIRDANIKKKKRLDMTVFANSYGSRLNVKLGDYNLAYLAIEVKSFRVTDTQMILPIRPSQNLKKDYKEKGISEELLLYEFYPLNREGDSFDPMAMMSGNTALKIYIAKEDRIDFESYIYNIKRPKPGDPIVDMSIVHNYSAPTSGGMFGCARVGTGCPASTIPNLPKYDDKELVHAGIDVYADLNTDVFAMYSGTIEKVVTGIAAGTEGTKGAFGNRIRIKSTPQEHKIGKNVTIYIYYTHLNEVKDEIKVGAKVKQGQKIGKTGNTGNAYNIPVWRYHTHINVYEGNTAGSSRVNPLNYFNTKFDINGNITQ